MRRNRPKGEMVEAGEGRIARLTRRKPKNSKICTSRGARDRRIRLSANTAIQFYDVQDRLGYDRPSNAIDWLMKKAQAAIDVLNADHYHHLHEFLMPDTTSSIFNLSEAFHRTPGDRTLLNTNHDEIYAFYNHSFETVNSRNIFPSQDESPIPVPQNINFPSSTVPQHFAWNTNYNTVEGYGLVNREPLQSNFNTPVVYTPNNEFTADDDHDGLLGFSFEHEIQIQQENLQKKEDDGNHIGRGVEGYMI